MAPGPPTWPFGQNDGAKAGPNVSPETLVEQAFVQSGWLPADTDLAFLTDHPFAVNTSPYPDPATLFTKGNDTYDIGPQSMDTSKNQPQFWHPHRQNLARTQDTINTRILAHNKRALNTRPSSLRGDFQTQGNTRGEKRRQRCLESGRGTKRAHDEGLEQRPTTKKRKRPGILSPRYLQTNDPIVAAICALWLARFRGRRPNGTTIRGLVLVLDQQYETLSSWFSQDALEDLSSLQCNVAGDYNAIDICELLCLLFLLRFPGKMPSDNDIVNLAQCFELDFDTLHDFLERALAKRCKEDSGYDTRNTSRRSQGSESPPLHCNCCSKTGKKTAKLTASPSKPPKKPYVCSRGCQASYSDKSGLIRHEKTHQEQWRCRYGICAFPSQKSSVFKRRDRVLKHIRKEHPDVDISENNLLICREAIDLDPQIRCHFQGCDSTFVGITDRNEHLFSVHGASSQQTDSLGENAQTSDESESDNKSGQDEASEPGSESSNDDDDPPDAPGGQGGMDPDAPDEDHFLDFNQGYRSSGSASQQQESFDSNYNTRQFAVTTYHSPAESITNILHQVAARYPCATMAIVEWLIMLWRFCQSRVRSSNLRNLANRVLRILSTRRMEILWVQCNAIQANQILDNLESFDSLTLTNRLLPHSRNYLLGMTLPMNLLHAIEGRRPPFANHTPTLIAPDQALELNDEEDRGDNAPVGIRRDSQPSSVLGSMTHLPKQLDQPSQSMPDVETSIWVRDLILAENISQVGLVPSKRHQDQDVKSPSSIRSLSPTSLVDFGSDEESDWHSHDFNSQSDDVSAKGDSVLHDAEIKMSAKDRYTLYDPLFKCDTSAVDPSSASLYGSVYDISNLPSIASFKAPFFSTVKRSDTAHGQLEDEFTDFQRTMRPPMQTSNAYLSFPELSAVESRLEQRLALVLCSLWRLLNPTTVLDGRTRLWFNMALGRGSNEELPGGSWQVVDDIISTAGSGLYTPPFVIDAVGSLWQSNQPPDENALVAMGCLFDIRTAELRAWFISNSPEYSTYRYNDRTTETVIDTLIDRHRDDTKKCLRYNDQSCNRRGNNFSPKKDQDPAKYVCTICGKMFRSEEAWKSHKSKHIGAGVAPIPITSLAERAEGAPYPGLEGIFKCSPQDLP